MIVPTQKEFTALAERANLIPVWTEIMADLETPVSAYLKLAGTGGYSYLLESVEGGSRLGRYSFLGFQPERVVSIRGRELEIMAGGEVTRETHDQPLARLMAMTQGYRLPEGPDQPVFCGGAVGYLAYDCVRHFEKLPDTRPDTLGVPDAVFMFAQRYLIFDRVTHRLRVVVNAPVGESPAKAYRAAVREVKEMVAALERPLPRAASPVPGKPTPVEVTASMSDKEYERAVERCLEHIASGDILQGVLSLRFRIDEAPDAFAVYRALRMLNPSPYMFHLRMGDWSLVGSSPETMVRVEGPLVFMNPIAGTRPRGASPAEDDFMEKDLLKDEKEGAEHLMLVDLARNDLGRVCLPGTVTVPSFRRVERFSHVMHLVSTVSGELAEPGNLLAVIRASFPAGTVSGAPKIRAMEIIDELETLRRGPYAGLVGYLDYRGSMDSCITIRTVLVKDGAAYVQAGAGIVADSRPEREYQECRHKAEALFKAVGLARGGRS